MYQINFDSPVHVHFIGIGGISMSGLAEVLLQEGFTISGSDSQQSELTRHLEEKGATVFYGQTADNIKPGIVCRISLSHRRRRYSRKDYYHFHDLHDPSGSTGRSYHLRGWYPAGDRWKYPRRQIRSVSDRSM